MKFQVVEAAKMAKAERLFMRFKKLEEVKSKTGPILSAYQPLEVLIKGRIGSGTGSLLLFKGVVMQMTNHT